MTKYSTIWPRFIAQLIDGFIMIPLFVILSIAPQYGAPEWFIRVWFAVTIAVQLGYLTFMHARWGQTLGKMYMNVKVLDLSEEPIRPWQAVVRSAPEILFGATSAVIVAFTGLGSEQEPPGPSMIAINSLKLVWALADVVWFLLDARRRALHDVIARTIVVRTEENPVRQLN